MSGQSRFKGRIKGPLKKIGGNNTSQEEYNKSWALLSEAFHEIHKKNAGSYTFEELYRNAYQIVLNKNADKLHAGFKQIVVDRLREVNKESIDVQYRAVMAASLTASTSIETSEARAAFLKTIRAAWDFHLICMGMMSDVLRYMDKVAFKEPNLPLVYDVGLSVWRDEVFRSTECPTGDHMTQTILQMIQDERNGSIVDRPLIKSNLDILQSLSAHGGSEVGETAYTVDFERDFLHASRQFYEQEAARLIQDLTAGEYLLTVDRRLNEEVERVEQYLSAETLPRIRTVVEHEMIAAYMNAIMNMESGLAQMLMDDRYADLANMFRLYSRVDPLLELFSQALTRQIVAAGDKINIVASEQVSTEKAVEKVNATTLALKWVEEVLDLRVKFDKILLEAFGQDQSIRNIMTKAFSIFINKNARSAEFISLFIDENLKKGLKNKTEQEVDLILEKTVSLFRYVHDKDVFERYYKNHLAKRLLNARSVSDDAERGMIAKLRVEVGSTFTSKMEGMFKDMKISSEMVLDFKKYEAKESTAPAIEINASVLTSTYWPITAGESGNATCVFPQDIEMRKAAFQKFYLSRHTGRTIAWLPTHGTADIRATLGNRKYELNVSTYAMAILLQFNHLGSATTLSFNELQSNTSIQVPELMRNLQSLACAKYRILNKEPKSRDVKESDVFSINQSFSSPQLRLKIATIANKVETEVERKDTYERIEETRKHQTEASIVRIMKARKTMDYNNLIAEVTKQLSSKFSPDPTMIKKRIESLIEREYLERDEADRKLYRYLA